MNYHLKYRPNTFEEVVGNETLVSTLQGIIEQGDIPHAILLHGPTGCGKTTLGRILANALGALGNDIREVDSADFRGIDTIRDIRKQSAFKPLEGPCRVWILDEVHQTSKDAQSALLKALEDTPKHVYYILCTTDPQKLLPTLKGRCSQFAVSTLTDLEMKKLLKRVTKAEGESLTKSIYAQIIQDSLGHPRDALQILAQVLAVNGDKRLVVATHAAEVQSQTIELCRALIQPAGWKKISTILKGLKDQEPESIRRAILGYCQAVILNNGSPQIAQVMGEFIEPFYNTGFPGLTYACYCAVDGEAPGF